MQIIFTYFCFVFLLFLILFAGARWIPVRLLHPGGLQVVQPVSWGAADGVQRGREPRPLPEGRQAGRPSLPGRPGRQEGQAQVPAQDQG